MVEFQVMHTARKITVEVPEELLERAQEASGEGITQTVRTGLRLVAASRTYARLRELRGKVKFSRTAADTTTWIAFLEGDRAPDTELLDQALRDRQLLMVPVVLTELLSDPNLPVQVARTLCDVPAVEIGSEY